MDGGSFRIFWLYIVLKYLLCSSWLKIVEHLVCAFVSFFPVPQTRTCFLKNHLSCLGIWNYILECKRMCGICLFFIDHHWMVDCYVYSWLELLLQAKELQNNAMCIFMGVVCNLNKVRRSVRMMFHNSQTKLIQNRVVFMRVYKCL